MATDWKKLWVELNQRQQTYLNILYDLDQANERHYKQNWNTRNQGFPPPASQWRWLRYDGGPNEYKNTVLRQRLQATGLVDPGTGSTFQSLVERGYIERKYETIEGEKSIPTLVLFVQITSKGRKLIRENLNVAKPPPKLPRGTLREWHWAAMVKLYAAHEQGGLASDLAGRYGGIPWSTLLRLRDYDPPLLQQIHEDHYRVQLTAAGLKFYEEQHNHYRQLYPNVVAPEPMNMQVLSVETPHNWDRLGDAIRDKRGQRGYREVSAEIGLVPSIIALIEKGKPATPEQYAQICQWLGISGVSLMPET